MASQSREKSMPFIKNMASSDRKTREQALASLRTFLSAKHISTALSTLDVLKLWKGLFYALWMCDRPLPQQQLCRDLSELVWVLPDEKAVVLWLRGFWATMAREWTTGIDVLRMEKFLMLVRRVFGVSLVWMQTREKRPETKKKATRGGKKRTANGDEVAADKKTDEVRWDANRVDQMLALLADWPFRPDEESRREADEEGLMPKLVPVGLKLHALDIWVDEAEKAGLLQGTDDTEGNGGDGSKQEDALAGTEVLRRLNELVEKLRADTLSVAVRKRSKDSLDDERLPWHKNKENEESDDGDEDVWRGLGD